MQAITSIPPEIDELLFEVAKLFSYAEKEIMLFDISFRSF